MDVVVTPSGSGSPSWSLKDRLGRPLGGIKQDTEGLFQISHTPGGSLTSIPCTHNSLREAMTAIAKHMHGACTLDGGDRGRAGV
jgi:hypothetical protein